MIQKNAIRHSVAILLGAAMAVPMTAFGAGFALIEQGARGMGNAYAGAAAVGDDASTIFFNPAAMTRLDRREMTGGTAVIDLRGDFTKESATDAIGQPISGGEGGNVGDGASPVPNLFYHHRINETTHFGLGIGAPFGLATSYDNDSIFRYQARLSDVAIVNINPSMAWKVHPNWSVGAGINIQYMHVELSNAVDYGAVCFNQLDPTTCASLGLTPQNADGNAVIEGSGVGYGFNLGVLGEGENTRVGIHFRSQVKHELEGNAKFTNRPAVFDNPAQQNNPFDNSKVDAEFRAPYSLSMSVAHEMSDRLTLLGDATYMGWSSFDELRVEYRNPTQPDTVEQQDYRNDMRYSLGLNFRHSDRFTLRGGVAYDESPVRDSTRTARLPDDDRVWLSLGLTYRHSANSEFDFAFTHLMLDDDIPLDHTGSQGDRIVGSYEVSANMVGLQWRYLFD